VDHKLIKMNKLLAELDQIWTEFNIPEFYWYLFTNGVSEIKQLNI